MQVLIFIISDIKETSQIKPSPEILLSNWRNKANQIIDTTYKNTSLK